MSHLYFCVGRTQLSADSGSRYVADTRSWLKVRLKKMRMGSVNGPSKTRLQLAGRGNPSIAQPRDASVIGPQMHAKILCDPGFNQ